ncbi:hypothetical protein ACL1FJ_00620 [Corynebacterium striatum]
MSKISAYVILSKYGTPLHPFRWKELDGWGYTLSRDHAELIANLRGGKVLHAWLEGEHLKVEKYE